MENNPVKTSGYAWYALGLLTFVYVLNFLDRTIIFLLFTPIKKEFGLAEKEILEIMKKKMPTEKFEMWKKKATANKPKPKPLKIDDFDEDLDGKYYIKNKLD